MPTRLKTPRGGVCADYKYMYGRKACCNCCMCEPCLERVMAFVNRSKGDGFAGAIADEEDPDDVFRDGDGGEAVLPMEEDHWGGGSCVGTFS